MPNGDAEDSENVLVWVYFSELLTYNAKGSICQSLSLGASKLRFLSKKKFTGCICFVMQVKLCFLNPCSLQGISSSDVFLKDGGRQTSTTENFRLNINFSVT